MFITQAKEILEAVPTAKYDEKSASKLIRSIEEEEEQMLEPLLGEDLMQLLYSQYKALIKEYGNITAPALKPQDGRGDDMRDIRYKDDAGEEAMLTVAAQQKTISMLRNIQCALVYRMLSNKIFSLSTSLNMGGGANRASAGDYEPADDKHLAEVRKEYYMNSRKSCDNILYMLERDAKSVKVVETADGEETVSDSLWLALWKESDGYYLKEDLLFPTLRSLKPYYTCNEPTKFLSLSPAIRYCQDTYISPRVDTDLMDRLLMVDNTLSASEEKALKLLRTALAYYVRAKEGARDERNEALMTADAAMSTALAYIEKNLSYDESQDVDASPSEPAKKCQCPCCNEKGGGEREREYSTFSTLFPTGVNRW